MTALQLLASDSFIRVCKVFADLLHCLASFHGYITGLGVCRYAAIKNSAVIDIVPVDIAINSLLIVARDIGLQTVPVTKVYNVLSSSHWTVTQKQMADGILNALIRSPLATAQRPLSHRTGEISQFEGKLIFYFSELLVAIIMDVVAKIRGKNSRMVKLTLINDTVRKDHTYFCQNSWIFPRKNMDDAVARLSKTDRELFPAIPIVENTHEYFHRYWMSLRELVIGEKTDNNNIKVDEAQMQQKELNE